MSEITAVILAYNERLHIERAIRNARLYASHIFVVDSHSTDNTAQIASDLGAQVVQHDFVNFSEKLNWALQNLPITTPWVLRQDSDEYLSEQLIEEIKQRVANAPDEVSGFTSHRKIIFLGREMKHGMPSTTMLRLFRHGRATCESRLLDEHMMVSSGRVETLKGDFYDDNLNDLTWWTSKHNGYASSEAIILLDMEYGLSRANATDIEEHSQKIRNKKLRYVRMPLFWRAAAFFAYRYFLRLGFLDGKEGFLWHFLQGWWYRTLADAKVYETKRRLNFDEERIKEHVRKELVARGIELSEPTASEDIKI